MVLLVSIVFSVSISAIAVSKLVMESSVAEFRLAPANPMLSDRNLDSSPSNEGSLAHEEAPSDGSSSEARDGSYAVPQGQSKLVGSFYSPLYESSPYIFPITWGAVAGTLIWRGKVRSQWCRQGYDYDMFRLLARMKGSPIRVALLTSVSNSARTRAQMAQDLDVDWKTIDNHIDVLSKNGLVQEIGAFGTSRYFAITERGKRVLSLLLSLDNNGTADITSSLFNNASTAYLRADSDRSSLL